MTQETILLKCGELVLKGLNRHKFEERLIKLLRHRLSPLGKYKISSGQSTIYVMPEAGAPVEEAVQVCQRLFGIVSLSRAAVCEKDINAITELAGVYLKDALAQATTFKVAAKRADKRFPLTSPQIGAEVGGYLHDLYPHLKPQMDNPDVTVTIEVREEHAFIAGAKLPGAGGLPGGMSGRGMLLLSGGIDSPVAGYMMAKRGLELGAVHFFSYPFTSEAARDKVLSLAERLSHYTGRLTVSLVPFTKIQMEIRDKCDEDYSTILTRRMMMRIAQLVARRQHCGALITGESLGQVASQTLESIAATDAVCDMPVFRPAIGMDKAEIVTIARKIDTYDTSILPHEDCCTVFTPRHPMTRPRLEQVEEQEQALDIEGLIAQAMEGLERVTL